VARERRGIGQCSITWSDKAQKGTVQAPSFRKVIAASENRN
jgi:hypothetical protein